MYSIYNSLVGIFADDRIAWYLGLITYWLVWGMAFPIIVIGKENIKELIRGVSQHEKVAGYVSVKFVD